MYPDVSDTMMLRKGITDTGLSELLVPLTRSDQFNKSLEIQQSQSEPS